MGLAGAGPSAGTTDAESRRLEALDRDALARLAEAVLEDGRVELARVLLEALAVASQLDGRAWAVLSRAHRRLGRLLAARFCAEVGARLSPAAPGVRLALAEALLATGDRGAARLVLREIAADARDGPRARALLAALPE